MCRLVESPPRRGKGLRSGDQRPSAWKTALEVLDGGTRVR